MRYLTYLTLLLLFVVSIISCEKEEINNDMPFIDSFVSFDLNGQTWEIESPDTGIFYNNTLSLSNRIEYGQVYEDTAEIIFNTNFNKDTIAPTRISRERITFAFHFRVPKDTLSVYAAGNKLETNFLKSLFDNQSLNISLSDQDNRENRVKIEYFNWTDDFMVLTHNVEQSASNFNIEQIEVIETGMLAGSLIIEGRFNLMFWGTTIGADNGQSTYGVHNGSFRMVIRNGGEVEKINSSL